MNKVVIAGTSVYGLNNLSDDAMFTVFCRGVPAIYICATNAHAMSTSEFVRAGIAVNLGMYYDVGLAI